MKKIFFVSASQQKIETSAKLKHFYWNVRFRLFFVVSETASGGRKPNDNNVKWGLQNINSSRELLLFIISDMLFPL